MRNTHPFEQDGRLFAHNGVLDELDRLDDRLRSLGAAHLVRGETDSERVFALITAETARRGGGVTDGIIAAIDWIGAHLPVYSLNFVLTTATDLWALRFPATHGLYVLQRASRENGVPSPLDAKSKRIHARCEHLAARACLIVASEPMDQEPGWRLLGPGELLHCGASLKLEITRPFPPQPSRPLARSDLDPRAEGSQHGAAAADGGR